MNVSGNVMQVLRDEGLTRLMWNWFQLMEFQGVTGV